MLRKLFKYDLQVLSRLLLIIHGFLILSAFLVRWFLTGQIRPEDFENGSDFLLGISVLLYFLIVMSVSAATSIIIAVRFYRNLFSDEGYLTHTLPVTRGQILLSKTLAGGLWALIDLLLLWVSVYIVAFPPLVADFFRENQEEILTELGFSGAHSLFEQLPLFLGAFFLMTVITSLSSVIMIYASVALGQLFQGHRVVGAVACYFALSTIFSVLSYASTLIGGISNQDLFISQGSLTGTSFLQYMSIILIFSTIWALFSGVVLYLVTYYILKKKMNLP